MLEGRLVRLRALTGDDALTSCKWRNDFDLVSMQGGNFLPVAAEREAAWLQEVVRIDVNNLRLAIEVKESGKYIGNVGVTSIDWRNRRGEFGIFIGDRSQWGQGFGFDATKAMLGFSFKELNLFKMFLTVRVDNDAAIKIYKKCGFKQEGLLRSHLFRGGRYMDVIYMGLLRQEFFEDAENNNECG